MHSLSYDFKALGEEHKKWSNEKTRKFEIVETDLEKSKFEQRRKIYYTVIYFKDC